MNEHGDAAGSYVNGLLGVLIFSGSMPATRVAVAELPPLFVTGFRATLAAILAAVLLFLVRAGRPSRSQLRSLSIVAAGVVVGFPLLTAFALQSMTAAHSLIFLGMLPLSTAAFGILRGEAIPQWRFWLFAGLGSAIVGIFALASKGQSSALADLLMVAAVLVCGLGYAEGAKLSRTMGSMDVIAWALIVAMPFSVFLAVIAGPTSLSGLSSKAWLGLVYVSIFSMFVGFVFWYRALATGGSARIGQLQLLQPFFGFLLAGVLLGERLSWPMFACAGLIVLCVIAGRRYA